MMLALLLTLAAAPTPTVALMPPTVINVELSVVDAALRAGLDRNVKVTSNADTAALIARAADNELRCDPRDGDCAARIGAFGGVDFVIVSVVDSGRARLTLIDCATGRPVRSVGAGLAKDDAFARGLTAIARAVITDGSVLGVIKVNGSGATVVVDGIDRGPSPRRVDVTAGAHVVVVGEGVAVDVNVPAAGVVSLDAAVAAPPPDALRARIGVVGVVVGSAIVVGGVIGAVVLAPDEARRDDVTAAAYNDAVTAGRTALVVAAAGALVAAGGGLLWWSSE